MTTRPCPYTLGRVILKYNNPMYHSIKNRVVTLIKILWNLGFTLFMNTRPCPYTLRRVVLKCNNPMYHSI